MLTAWRQWHDGPRLIRWPLKALLFVIVTLLVLFPNPSKLATLLDRLANLDRLIDSQHPGLARLEEDVRRKLPDGASARAALPIVEKTVYQHVPYAFDWDNWGVMEWLPTVDEVLTRGREDCDGRAVVAASLLRRLGYDAWLVTDILHMWVETPEGETMAPTGGAKTLSGGRPGQTGTQASIDVKVLNNAARGMAFGVAVFPLLREIIIVAALALLTLHPRAGFWRSACGCLLLWIGLYTLRDVGEQAARHLRPGDLAAAWAAAGAFAVGWATLAFKGSGRLAGWTPARRE